MAVLRRVEPIGEHSTHLATSTVVGMVLGVLSLFAMVVAYQFIPRRKRTKSPAIAALAPPSPTPRPLLSRIRTRCTTFFKFLTCESCEPNASSKEAAQPGHKGLRSFHLTPERRRERESNRKKFSTALRLNLKIDIPAAFSHDRSPAATPRPPKRAYARMKEADDMCESLVKSDTAPASPWSPTDEYLYLRTPPPRFKPTASPVTSSPRSPPPLYPPPPAYVPGTPIRGAPTSPAPEDSQKRHGVVDPFDDSAKVEDDSASLMREIDEVIQMTMNDVRRGGHDDPFVIEDGDDETGSMSECSL